MNVSAKKALSKELGRCERLHALTWCYSVETMGIEPTTSTLQR